MKFVLSAALALSAAVPLAAQTVVTNASPQGWALDGGHTQGGGTATITGTYVDPNLAGDNGSLQLTMPNGSAAAAYSLTINPLNSFNPTSLSSFTSASFDWYRSSSSTASSQLAPVFAFDIRYTDHNSGELVFGQLEWEAVYNGIATAPTNTWETSNLTNGIFWVQGGRFGQSPSERGPINTACGNTNQGGSQLFQTIADWASSSCLSGAIVYGVNLQVGSGWSGSFDGAVDNVNFAFSDGPQGSYNFQSSASGPSGAVPEPATLSLMATGLVGLAGAARRRKRNK